MSKEYQINLLSNEFYNKYPSSLYPEMELKQSKMNHSKSFINNAQVVLGHFSIIRGIFLGSRDIFYAHGHYLLCTIS